uniref:ATP synthase complex subunit 8 n=1 Tax=Archaster typicus TaxID=136937 RepID=A0A5J6RMC5_9ECHI|nr:ATP synthase F0 subunit 8 [Archaster typicus]
MPQLNLAWWLINFLIGWTALTIVFTITLNISLTTNLPNTNTKIEPLKNLSWIWT